jgi:CRP/FNR family transcriptional regulator, cyclic AMP receptor protein
MSATWTKLEICEPPEHVWEAVQTIAVTQTFAPEIHIFHQGESSNTIYFIKSGLVKIVCNTQDGEEIITGLRSSGWFLGTEAVILGIAHSGSAITLSSCDVGRIPEARFRALLVANVTLSRYVHHLHCLEIFDLVDQHVSLRTNSPRARFTEFLCRFLNADGQNKSGPIRLQIPLKCREMAQLLSISPEHLCRVMGQMEHEGLLRREKHSLTILNPGELLRSAHSPNKASRLTAAS